MLGRFLSCCHCGDDPFETELKVVQLTSDALECHMGMTPVQLLTPADAFDMGQTPRSYASFAKTQKSRSGQKLFRESIRLPEMGRYPVPLTCSLEDSEEHRHAELLRIYQDHVMELHHGIPMVQLTPQQHYADVHCQVSEDFQTLKVDQGSGCIIEFPLLAVSKVYRVVKNDDKWYGAGSLMGPTPMPPLPLSNAEHIVVMEFMRRKLALIFNEVDGAQTFLMCMDLLVRRAQECFGGAAVASVFSITSEATRESISPSPAFLHSAQPLFADPGFGPGARLAAADRRCRKPSNARAIARDVAAIQELPNRQLQPYCAACDADELR
jgi:hypothetical protein